MERKKKILTILVIVLLLIVLVLAYLLFYKYVLKTNFEKEILTFANNNEKTVFQINKIVLFSNCDAKNKTGSSTNFTIENLYQYTDIAIFLDSPSQEEKALENTLKKVSVHDFHYLLLPKLGEPKFYFKSFNQFAKSDLIDENEIHDSLDFTITSEDEADLNTPTLYNNLANPITLSYVNTNIKPDYTITDTSKPITYDGSLLERCHIPLDSIACHFSFDITITNNQEENFKTTVLIDIPLQEGEKSIYDGNLQVIKNTNFTFYRYQ